MTPARWNRVGELFHEALAVPGGQGRQWVESACPDDPEVVAEVLSLLGSDADAGEGFVAKQIQPAIEFLLEAGPARVGPYRLIRELGRGGMGTVYLAERDDEEYQTQVAIKLVRRGMDTDLILHRFYRERQTLARLQHPHIARLLDGGTTEEGLPYIVMEFVKGSKITDYCRERGLRVAERLRLFLDICDAVDHAHREFVVHRDLKPGNILVDERGAVKLLDFGVCKLLQTDPALGSETLEAGPAPLTPDYASPEQIRGEPTNVASDVYSLAAVLYELMTEAKPHKIKEYTLRGIERGICEEEIVRPSLAVSNRALARQLRGDIDNILLHGLQKDPRRRYVSVEQFGEDVRRHLAHQPVKARPDSVVYRMGKFVRRQKVVVAAAAAVLVTMSAGVWVSARSARIANENLGLVRQLSNTFVFDVYDVVRDLPGSTRARQLIVQTGLRYLDSLSRNASGNSELQRELAAAYRRIGDVQGNVMGANLGNTAEALASYQKALALLDAVLQGNRPQRPAMAEQVTLHQRIGAVRAYTKDQAQALVSFREAVRLAEALAARFPEDEGVGRQLAETHLALAEAVRRTGDYTAAREGDAKALALLARYEAAHPGDRELQISLAAAYSGVGLADARLGRLREALEGYRQAAARLEKIVRLDPSNVTYQRELMFTYSHMGDVLGNPNLRNLGDKAGAVEAYGQMTAVARRIHEADPADQRARSDYGIALSRVAAAMPEQQAQKRIALLRQAIGLHQEVARVNPDNLSNRTETAFNYNFLGDAHLDAGEPGAAEQAYREGLRLLETMRAPRSATATIAAVMLCRKLGEAAASRGDQKEGLEYGRRALELTDPDGAAAKGRPAELQRLLTPRGYAAMGLVHAALARTKRAAPENAREARRWLTKSLEKWRELEKQITLSNAHRREMRAVETALERVK